MPGQIKAEGLITALLQLHQDATAPVVLVTPTQGWGQGDQGDHWVPWHWVGTEGKGRDGRDHSPAQLSCPLAASGKKAHGEMGGKPQNLGPVLPLPTGLKEAALKSHWLPKAAGQALGLARAKPPCLH